MRSPFIGKSKVEAGKQRCLLIIKITSVGIAHPNYRKNNFMEQANQDNLIFFMHIPKTAGTTLHHIIRQQYGEEHVFKAYIGVGAATLQEHIDDLRSRLDNLDITNNLANNQTPEIKLILGHVGFGLHEILGRNLTYITFLRHPIDRVISWYYHQQRIPSAKYYQESQSMGLKELITHFQPMPTDNHQTRYLAGDTLREKLGLPNLVSYGYCDRSLFEQAKENLRKYFLVVGIQEHFDDSLWLLQKSLGWQNISYAPENIGHNKQTISQSEIDFVQEYNYWDLQLYEYAKKLFYQQINKLK